MKRKLSETAEIGREAARQTLPERGAGSRLAAFGVQKVKAAIQTNWTEVSSTPKM
ncbi:hypothetical protein KEU06_28690 [Pseudaminobacter sp. 19-2017]|uniref:Uncharacterized protein n=1 Tax=Pseudaminobacter soli (ex Zhang et al. 2022) TaxID=2831468 RepID=A0A942E8W2_9HYPH|nr:hypothetical protein [Pseudaminobacter soli]MBS3652560.1 hypothetical protein [Pseudaminobacter soli]